MFHSSFIVLLLMLLLLLAFVGPSEGQSGTIQVVDMMGKSRTNWTIVELAVVAGKVTMDKALGGQTVTVGVDPSIGNTKPLLLTFDAVTGLPNGGHIYLTINRAAKKNGCIVKWMKFPPQGTMSDDAYVQAMVPLVDIFAAFYIHERDYYRPVGVMPTVPAMFSPALLITTSPPVTPLGYWNFGTPYAGNMWILMVATFIFQGFCQWLVMKKDKDDGSEIGFSSSSRIYNVFESVNSWSGDKISLKHNVAMMILTIGFNFLLFILTASYLANLSSLLYLNSIPPAPLVDTMSMANTNAQTLCLAGNSTLPPTLNPNINFLRHRYPLIRLLQAPFPDYINMIGDKCDGAIAQSTDWMVYKGSNVLNPGDLLFQRGPPLLQDSNRFATYMDFTEKKTVFLNKAFSVGLLTVQQTSAIMTDYYNLVTAAQDFVTKWDSLQPSISLSLQISDMAGIFILYGIGVLIAAFWFYLEIYCKLYVRPRTRRLEEESVAATEATVVSPVLGHRVISGVVNNDPRNIEEEQIRAEQEGMDKVMWRSPANAVEARPTYDVNAHGSW